MSSSAASSSSSVAAAAPLDRESSATAEILVPKQERESPDARTAEPALLASPEDCEVDCSDRVAVLQSVANEGPIDWVLMEVEDLKIVSCGGGSLAGLQKELQDDHVFFGVVRISHGSAFRRASHVFVHWIGQEASVVKQGRSLGLRSAVEDDIDKYIHISLSMEAHSLVDLEPALVVRRLKHKSIYVQDFGCIDEAEESGHCSETETLESYEQSQNDSQICASPMRKSMDSISNSELKQCQQASSPARSTAPPLVGHSSSLDGYPSGTSPKQLQRLTERRTCVTNASTGTGGSDSSRQLDDSPMDSTGLSPMDSTGPSHMDSTGPALDSTGPSPMDSTGPSPMDSTGPSPTDTTGLSIYEEAERRGQMRWDRLLQESDASFDEAESRKCPRKTKHASLVTKNEPSVHMERMSVFLNKGPTPATSSASPPLQSDPRRSLLQKERVPEDLSGTLLKKSGIIWKQRFFKLNKGQLQWWLTEESCKSAEPPLKTVPLHNGVRCCRCELLGPLGQTTRFSLQTSSKEYKLDAVFAPQALLWVEAFTAHAEYIDTLLRTQTFSEVFALT